MSHRIDTVMDTVQTASSHATRNTGWGKAGRLGLRGRHDAVLVRGDARDHCVRAVFVAFFSHSERKATNAAISPPSPPGPPSFIAGVRPSPRRPAGYL
jgi:hypothetical protein